MAQLKLTSERMADRYETQATAQEGAAASKSDGLVSWQSHHASARMAGEVEIIHGEATQ